MNKKLKIVGAIIMACSASLFGAAMSGIFGVDMGYTSDKSKVAQIPRPPARYIAPHINIYPKFVTNTRPLVVEITISSNVEQLTLWWDEGYARTNYTTLASNVISVTTNEVGRP